MEGDPDRTREAHLPFVREVRLRDLLRPRKTTIDYLYDFGDCWEHRITVTNVRPGDPDISYPRYIDGKHNAPPEDCGGITGFYATLEALADLVHPDHAEAAEWLEECDPEAIDELPIKYALGRIASRRNAAKADHHRVRPQGRPESRVQVGQDYPRQHQERRHRHSPRRPRKACTPLPRRIRIPVQTGDTISPP